MNTPINGTVQDHSTNGMAVTVAARIKLKYICDNATWKSTRVFPKQYYIERKTAEETVVGQAVLQISPSKVHLIPTFRS